MNGEPSFNTDSPLAYFLTWTTYGTWLPGDERGWKNRRESDVLQPNPLFAEEARSLLRESQFRLSEQHRRIVEDTIRDHCRVRGWPMHAVNARTNHVHVVVAANGYRPESVRDQFKSWATRRLKADVPARTRFWTEGASCRWINNEDDLEAAVLYVVQAQDRKGTV